MNRALLSSAPLGLGLALLCSVRPGDVAPIERFGTTAGEVVIAGSAEGTIAPALRRHDERDRAAVLKQLQTEEAGTYIGEILRQRDSSLARWPDRNGRPLRVWIQPYSTVGNWTPAHPGLVREAFQAWADADFAVRFAFVRDSAQADVHVNWTDRFSQPISGRTRWSRDERWRITDAHILLAVHHHSGPVLDASALRAMALHEVGHLLGLDHTQDPSSVMAPRVRARSLSDADRATIRLLYSLPPGALR